MEWALAYIIAGDGAAAAGLPTPEKVSHNPIVCQNQTYLGHEALRQAPLPIREVGLGLTSSSSMKGAAYIGSRALVLRRVVAASARGNLPSLLERLPERPMASVLIEELKIGATGAKRSQRGCSGQRMGSPSGGRGPSRKRIRNSTGQSGSRRRRRGRAGGRWEGGGAGVLTSENSERIRWQPSLVGRMS